MREVKKTLLALLLVLTTALPVLSQTPTCDQGRLQAIAEQNLHSCIQPFLQGGSDEVTFEVTCACAEGGSVNVFATPRCHPGEFCPQFVILVGSAEIDCNGNLITAICFNS
ncbi:MAG TPA: hypothetical protein VIA62_14705 [Thermoanaerobaculia bacterium]|jgi:hypothetical protein|nr:hypothetical protein [Thermoanaerobaculia bacterium]